MQLVDQLSTFLKEKGVSVLKFSNETGISAYKIYKWIDGKGNPKHEDVNKIEEWLRSFPPGTQPGMKYTPITSSDAQLKIVGNYEEDRLIKELRAAIARLEAENEFLKKQNEKLISMLDSSMQTS